MDTEFLHVGKSYFQSLSRKSEFGSCLVKFVKVFVGYICILLLLGNVR